MSRTVLSNLTAAEREALSQLVARERVSGLKRMRASILLKADDGMTDTEIADDLDVALVTVERVRKRCVERGIEACLDRKQQDNPSRPRKLACSEPPTGRARWTLSLLAGRLVELKIFDSVSKSTVQGFERAAERLLNFIKAAQPRSWVTRSMTRPRARGCSTTSCAR